MQFHLVKLLNIKKPFINSKKKLDGFKRLSGNDARMERELNIVKPYKNFEIGDFTIKSAPVDHSLPGASAFIMENNDETYCLHWRSKISW